MATAMNPQMSKSESGEKKQAQKSKHENIPYEIQCKICKKRYEDPKLLPCLHTYCKACLKRSVRRLNTTTLYLFCPVCPNETAYSKYSRLENLQSNVMVSNLLLAANDLEQGLSSKQCESCEEMAISRCVECSDFLCGNCVEKHKQNPSTKKHRIVAIKNLNVDAMVESTPCDSHPQEALEAFCTQCKKPVCKSCKLGEHKKHSQILLEEAVDDINELLKKRVYILLSKLEKVYASKQELEVNVRGMKKEIQETIERILTAVEKQENYLYEWLKRIRNTRRKKLESKEQALKNDLAQVLQSCNLSGREDHAVPETAESEIKNWFKEKTLLDILKKCLQLDCSEFYGTFLCREIPCKTCWFIDSRAVISTKKSKFPIIHHFTCKSTNLIYCISCSKCGLLYIGETGGRLQTRFGQHRRPVENPEEHDQTRRSGVVEHFTSDGHCVDNMKVRALCPCPDKDETRPKDEKKRREQEESRLIDELGTFDPLIGLNKKR